MSEPIRSFIAVDVTAKAVIEAVSRLQRELLSTGADLKPVELHNLHLTLIFLGEQPKRTLDEVAKRLEQLNFRRFEVEFRGVGAFPNSSSPRVIWVDVGRGRRELVDLAHAVRELVRDIAREDEEFTPHLTVARVKGPRNKDKLAEMIGRHSSDVFGAVEVSEVKLKRSILTPRGPIYSDLYVKRLSA